MSEQGLTSRQKKIINLLKTTRIEHAEFRPYDDKTLKIWLGGFEVGAVSLSKFRDEEFLQFTLYESEFLDLRHRLKWIESIDYPCIQDTVDAFVTELSTRCFCTWHVAEKIWRDLTQKPTND